MFLLDDDPDFCQEMTYLLEEVVQFSAFTEPDLLLAALKTAQPDMILVDLNLNKENENGIDVVSEIKRLPGSHLYCVVMLTGADASEVLPQAYRSGIHDYLRKPVVPSEFLPKLENLLYHNRQRVHTNALTGLPGIVLIEEEYDRRAISGSCTVGYLDLDHFKPFNDAFGVKAGDKGILVLANIFHSLRTSFKKENLFLGHLGGDDFFLVGQLEACKEAVHQCYDLFARKVRDLFTDDQIADGYYTSKSRAGELQKFPILSCSTVLLNLKNAEKFSFEEVSELAASGKKQAKSKEGNSLVVLDL